MAVKVYLISAIRGFHLYIIVFTYYFCLFKFINCLIAEIGSLECNACSYCLGDISPSAEAAARSKSWSRKGRTA